MTAPATWADPMATWADPDYSWTGEFLGIDPSGPGAREHILGNSQLTLTFSGKSTLTRAISMKSLLELGA